MATLQLTMDQMLTAIDLLDEEDKEKLEHALEEREWQKLYRDDFIVLT